MSEDKWTAVFAPTKHPGDKAQASLQQLQTSGVGLDVLEEDAYGPLRVRRRSMVDTIWHRVSGRGIDARYEPESDS